LAQTTRSIEPEVRHVTADSWVDIVFLINLFQCR